jgi:hypothetical protein
MGKALGLWNQICAKVVLKGAEWAHPSAYISASSVWFWRLQIWITFLELILPLHYRSVAGNQLVLQYRISFESKAFKQEQLQHWKLSCNLNTPHCNQTDIILELCDWYTNSTRQNVHCIRLIIHLGLLHQMWRSKDRISHAEIFFCL